MAAQERGDGMKALLVPLQQAQTVSLFRQGLSHPSLIISLKWPGVRADCKSRRRR